MAHELEAPTGAERGAWDSLYLSRGDDVSATRPVFTGDVFADVTVNDDPFTALILQHPCALRINGVDLTPRLLVAKVDPAPLLPTSAWKGNYRKMPLPELGVGDGDGHCAALFTEVDVVDAVHLDLHKRVAALSQPGVNLLLQRWVHHNSRVVVPTSLYQAVTSGPYEEADLTEEWCDEALAHGVDIDQARNDVHQWLREWEPHGNPRQRLLEDPQQRSAIRKEMRRHLRERLGS